MPPIPDKFLSRIESLGDNCELGFVMRNLKYEKSSLFRWTITPVNKLVEFMADPERALYNHDDLSPFSPGMVIDKESGFSFHSKMKSEKNDDGKLTYIATESERDEMYANEKSKIEYMRTGFIQRLIDGTGSIYLIKANKGIAEAELGKLSIALRNYSPKHVLVEVRADENSLNHELKQNSENHFVAHISRFAPYVKANDVLFQEWNLILESIQNNKSISEQIG